MAQNERFRSEIVQLARFGAAGDIERVRIQVMRFIRTLRGAGDELADTLQAVTFPKDGSRSSTGRSSEALRRATSPAAISEPVPTDIESRLDLLRIEDPPVLPYPIVQDKQVIAQLDQLVLERKSMMRLTKLGLQPPKSVLFIGPPGVGKTMAARHVALQMGLPLLVLDLATVISSYLGKTGNNIKQAFSFARKQPCVFFLDEIDAVAKRRDDESDIGELKRLVTVLLQEIDLWSPNNLLLAATNHGQLLDSAVWRRFDENISFPRPGYNDLCRLADSFRLKDDPLPSGWASVAALLATNTSQSNFVRDLNRLRRGCALGGKRVGMQVMTDLVSVYSESMTKADKKQLSVLLVKMVGMSQRDASRIAGVARETLRTQLKQDV